MPEDNVNGDSIGHSAGADNRAATSQDMSQYGTVLIIDDDEVVLDVLTLCLQDHYKLILASNGTQGLAMARTTSPDLIVLDIGMPDINGYELCSMLRMDAETRNIPIIFLTAFSSVDDEARGLNAGAVDYLAKPVSPPLVKARVATHMELKRQRDYLQALVRLDGLTGVFNRRWLDESLEREWRRAVRAASPISFLLVDVDSFKAYNDLYGHIGGDDCLKEIARLLAQIPRRGGDFVARYGGEEFAVVLPGTDFDSARELAERCRASIEAAQIVHAGSQCAPVVTVSIGAATVTPRSQEDRLALVAAADKALYEAKASGRNVVCAVDMDRATDEQVIVPIAQAR